MMIEILLFFINCSYFHPDVVIKHFDVVIKFYTSKDCDSEFPQQCMLMFENNLPINMSLIYMNI